MEEFTVYVKNRPGELSRICGILAKYGINIVSLATEGTRSDGTMKLVTDDVNTTKKALENSRIKHDIKDVMVVNVPNRQGELSKVTGKLGVANINIESIYLLSDGRFAIRTNDTAKARVVLKNEFVR